MLVPFYVVFCHHRKVSEYTVDCLFFFIYGCIKPVSVPMLTPPNHCRNQEEGGHEHQNWTAGQQTLMSHNFFYIIWMAGCCAFFTW